MNTINAVNQGNLLTQPCDEPSLRQPILFNLIKINDDMHPCGRRADSVQDANAARLDQSGNRLRAASDQAVVRNR